MKKSCKKWKDRILESALTGTADKDLAKHLRTCADCAAELETLEARRAQLDTLLPLVAQSSEPSADFQARVLAAAEAATERARVPRWRLWKLTAAMAASAAVLVLGAVWYRGAARNIPAEELVAAQKLAEWRAPSDSLLATPGQELLRTTPKLGETYLHVPVKKPLETPFKTNEED